MNVRHRCIHRSARAFPGFEPRRYANAATLLAFWLCACGSDGGKGSETGSHGAGGRNPMDASRDGSDSTQGSGGHSPTGTGGHSTQGSGGADEGGVPRDAGPLTPGTVNSIWKRASAHVTGFDSAMPLAGVVDDTVALASTYPSPEFGDVKVDIYEQIDGDSLMTYCLLAGDSVYYRVQRPLTGAGGQYFVTTGDLTRILELRDGQLVEQVSYNAGTSTFLLETTFDAYDGAFPPPSWPKTFVDFGAMP